MPLSVTSTDCRLQKQVTNSWGNAGFIFISVQSACPTNGFDIIDVFWGSVTRINFKKAKTKLRAVSLCLIASAVWPRSLSCVSIWVAGSTLDMRKPCYVFNSIMRMTGEHGRLYRPSSRDWRTSSKPESCLMFAYSDNGSSRSVLFL